MNRKPMGEVVDGFQTIPYKIVESARRKTIGIQIKRDGEVLVRIPKGVPVIWGHQFATEHARWIGKTVKKVEAKKKERQIWQDGTVFTLAGQARTLIIQSERNRKDICIVDTGDQVIVRGQELNETRIENSLKGWFKSCARSYLEDKTRCWSEVMGVEYNRIAIRDQVTRWGSCSSKGNINYNWRLILLSEPLADYVVVHELCHRKEMNHSAAFWRLVEQQLPQYKELKQILKQISIEK